MNSMGSVSDLHFPDRASEAQVADAPRTDVPM